MRSLTLHLKVLIAILVSLGVAITAYQIFVLGIPVTEAETDNVWNIDAKVDFQASPRNPVKVQMFVPPLGQDFVSLNESFISNNYGVSVNNVDGNRRVTWSARRASGPQTLYYRMVLTQRYSTEKPKEEGPIYREGLPLAGPEQIAAEALLAPIRQHSADVETFISETIKRVNNLNDDNVKLLLAGDTSVEKRASVIDLLLSIAHVPLEQVHTIRLAKQSDASANSGFLEYSLYGLPLQTQQTYQIMIMIPIGVLVILILRNLGGLQTLGTFTPVLIALAFRETQIGFGIILFTLITALGLSLRSYLEHLKLQMLPRLSVVLTFVVVLIAVISLLSHKLGLERGLSVSLFPMVILTMTIERLSITWEERGGGHAFKVAVGTLIAASLAFMLMNIQELTYFIFTFPAVLLIMVGFMLAMGRYRGYRLTELFRFKAFLKD